VKASSPISCHCAIEHRATQHALVTHHVVTARSGSTLGLGLAKGHHGGPASWAWPSRPLWPWFVFESVQIEWATVKPEGTMRFFVFFQGFIQIEFKSNLVCL
jgi:hypothetical protein